jgi:mono/diheme cytochrome c family protein
MYATGLALVGIVAGCAGEAPPASPVAASPDAPLPPATGLIDSPAHGSVIAGDPETIVLHVVAHHGRSNEPCSVQVLAQPDDLASWTTIATATTDQTSSGVGYGLAVDVRPVTGTSDAARWPIGGVLRLRVIDSEGTPFLASGFEEDRVAMVAVVNPQSLPTQWKYLAQKPTGSVVETQAYYAATAAPATLAAFMTKYGFAPSGGAGEIAATYYNGGDLAIGREMHCIATAQPANGAACYVSNFGAFDGDASAAITALETGTATPIATVAMVYSPPITAANAVTFAVYSASGALQPSAQLDAYGDNTSVPQNCLNCHGSAATYDAATHAASGARFLPFDPAAFQFSTHAGMRLQDELAPIYQLDQLVLGAAPTSGIQHVIDGLFPNAGTYAPTFVPAGWSASTSDRAVYQGVVGPYCRTCHASHEAAPTGIDPLAFESAQDFRANAAAIIQSVCGNGPLGMPAAQATTSKFFASGARALLLTYLDAPGACAVP